MDSAIQNEKKIVRLAKSDPDAFGELYDYYYAPIHRFILSRIRNRETAQDITSETFFIALKNIWRYQLSHKPFSAWLYKIASSQICNFYRSKLNYCEITSEECPELLNKHSSIFSFFNEKNMSFDRIKQMKILNVLLNKLKKHEHNIIVLRYFEEMSFKEISQSLGMKINTVKSHCRRGLNRLNKLFNDYYKNEKFNEAKLNKKYRGYITGNQS